MKNQKSTCQTLLTGGDKLGGVEYFRLSMWSVYSPGISLVTENYTYSDLFGGFIFLLPDTPSLGGGGEDREPALDLDLPP